MLQNMETITDQHKIKRRTRIRRKLFALILPTCLIPLLGISAFTSLRVYNYLEKQSQMYYSTLITQVRKNVAFMIDQYDNTFTNIFKLPSVIDGLNKPAYTSIQQEKKISESIVGGGQAAEGKASLRATVQERIDGQVLLYEIGRRSLLNNTSYKVHRAVDPSVTVYIPDFTKMMNDPLIKTLQEDTEQHFIFGMFKKGVLPKTYVGTDRPIMIFPYQQNQDKLTKFVLVQVNSDFLPDFYNNINALRHGTLYILDQFNNVISFNHPDRDDYYEYDNEKMHYVLGNDDPNDPDELLSFTEYQMLITDQSVLQSKEVQQMFSELNNKSIEGKYTLSNYVFFKGRPYLTIMEFDTLSMTRFVYFHPVQQIQDPILKIIYILLIITAIVTLVIIVISFTLSRSFTTPIHVLTKASKFISRGNYSHLTNITTGDELEVLSNNFNTMIRNVKAFQDQLLSVEREKTEIDVASRIQTCLLPDIPNSDNYDIAAQMKPTSEVGGDYYDFITGDAGDRLWMGIGDVSGNGLTSGLIIMMAQTAFNTILLNKPEISTDELIKKVNRVMYQNIKSRLGEDNFMSLSFMVADKRGQVRYSGAHLDILVFRKKSCKVERVETIGAWLGIKPDITDRLPEKKIILKPGDMICLYTDGITKTTDTENNEYGTVRLIDLLEKLGNKPVQEIINAIFLDVMDYTNEQNDDMTLVLLKKR